MTQACSRELKFLHRNLPFQIRSCKLGSSDCTHVRDLEHTHTLTHTYTYTHEQKETKSLADALKRSTCNNGGEDQDGEKNKALRREMESTKVRLEAELRMGEERLAEAERLRADKANLQARISDLERQLREVQEELEKIAGNERESRRVLAEAREESRSNSDTVSKCTAYIRQMHNAVCKGSKASVGGAPGGVGITVCSVGGKIVVKSVAEGGSADASGEIAAGNASAFLPSLRAIYFNVSKGYLVCSNFPCSHPYPYRHALE
jgi:hypothetical protein